jgi:hypothetical protein
MALPGCGRGARRPAAGAVWPLSTEYTCVLNEPADHNNTEPPLLVPPLRPPLVPVPAAPFRGAPLGAAPAPEVPVVPEADSLLLLAAGLGMLAGLAGLRRRGRS